MKKKTIGKVIATAVTVLLGATMIMGCKKKGTITSEVIPVDPGTEVSSTSFPVEPESVVEIVEETSEAQSVTGKADGERFSKTIMLEGMEESVEYEHAINNDLMYEIDFECESMTRERGSGVEAYVSSWDDPDNPENYLSIMYSTNDIDTQVEKIKEALSNDFTIDEVSVRTLDLAGDCKFIDASIDKNTGLMADHLQGVYFVPAKDGGTYMCTTHYAIEAAEGFGNRFRYMMNSFVPLR